MPLLFHCYFAHSANATTHQVGFASLDITPAQQLIDEGDVYMGGYGLWTTRGAAESVHDPLKASAVCISDSTNDLCIVILDSLGLSGQITNIIGTKINSITGIPVDNIFVGATHTHAAPDLLGLWGGSPNEYQEHLINQASRAVAEAYLSRTPANLFYSVGQGKAFNRRGWGYTDETITVIEALAENGTRLGTVINFAAHPVVSRAENLQISSDYVHYLREYTQDITEAPVVYINGAIGDVNPMQDRAEDEWKSAKIYGEMIADAAYTAMISRQPISAGIYIARKPFTTEVNNTVLALGQFFGIIEDNSSGPPWAVKVNSSVGRFSLGNEVDAVAVPGEAVTRLGLAIKADMQAPVKLFLGLSGGSLGYFIPADEWETDRNENYEESVSLGQHIAGQVQELLGTLKQHTGTIKQ